ncbi:glycosyl hydrolase [Foetidibacter luteolus]|uniref:glycosyl hydrolase n=1 Tax=Foetidibacter luteolus TaxID=2608880 RepID=UPI00129A7D68|nr:glycosyl hydrolase [Foetidibacter luteolus]
MKRRRFVQLASLSAASIPFMGFKQKAAAFTAAAPEDGLFQQFVNPAGNYRPFVRWWWNGDRVTKDEVLRELDLLKEAGIGGVEINPIRWPENADPIGVKELSWGSPEWLDVVQAAVTGAKEKGITCDMIVGSGWPFGGEFVPRGEQCEMIALGTMNIDGGKQINLTKKQLLDSVNPAFAFGHKNSEKELFLLRLAPYDMSSFVEGTDLNHLLSNEQITFDVPAGDYVLYYLVKITGFAAVIQGALGANGPVINHYNQTAVENYLDGFGQKLTSKLGPLNQYFRAFFTDSIELEGANWCSDMFEQFQQRRGYSLVPYFPYMLFKTGEMGNAVKEEYGAKFSPAVKEMLSRVRYDFEITKHELFHERFIKTFTGWCKKHGVKARMQAYGMDCHPLEATMLLDIPECETWIWNPEIDEFDDKGRGRNYTMINKFVSSAAHLAGKQLVSCEEMTNTGEIFNVTLERIKVTGDQSNLSGVTHSILHGFNYSPVEAPFPGWIRYGSFLNERNTWWPYFRLWADYKSRISCVLQNSVMQADIAVLHPLADLASRHGFQRDPFPQVTYPPYVHLVWEAIHQNGHGCDYTSEHILQQSTISNGKLQYNSRSYHTLILIEVETLEPATAEKLKQFADAGGKIIFIAKTPHISSGLLKADAKGKKIADISRQILSRHKKTTAVVAAPGSDMIAWFTAIQQQFALKPYLRIDKPVRHVNQLYYADGQRDIFFFANYSAQYPHRFTAMFNSKKTPWLWNAETGERYIYPLNSNGALEIELGPSETKLLVFEENNNGEKYLSPATTSLKEAVVSGDWKITLKHANGTQHQFTIENPAQVVSHPLFKNFAGTVLFQKKLQVTGAPQQAYLDLGKLYDITEVEINGRNAGAKWYGNHLYNITAYLQPGDNYLSIKLTTVLGNYTNSLKTNKPAQEWGTNPVKTPIGLVNGVKLLM